MDTIALPVIHTLRVNSYELYPGKKGEGNLHIGFVDGVTVLAGINGVGKTTLLNLLLRMIVGPSDPAKNERDIGRVSKKQLSIKKRFDYFSDRVPGFLSDEATAEIVFSIGDHEVNVVRFLNSMRVKSVVIDKESIRFEGELAIIEYLAKLSGLASGYDFHIVVRYLQFFTEERLPILWSPATQFEFFKMLLIDRELSENLNSIYSAVQRIDTNIRNRQHQLNKKKDNLPKVKSSSLVEIEVLDKMILNAERAFELVSKEYEVAYEVFKSVQQEDLKLENLKAEFEATLYMLEQDFAQADASYISSVLPRLDDKLNFLMQGLVGGKGCFVCGSKNKLNIKSVSDKLKRGCCFVCDGQVGEGHKYVQKELSLANILELEKNLKAARDGLAKVENNRVENARNHKKSSEALKEISSKRMAALQTLESYRFQRPRNTNAPSALSFIEQEEAELSLLSVERKNLTEAYRSGVGIAQTQMESMIEEVQSTLTRYAQAFLQEKVQIGFKRQTPFKLATGAGQVNIPSFSILMTSSTHSEVEERRTSESVSESQKEFLDLAFRMTLMDLISKDKSIMMVVETPEASLDAWFMRRAADLMRQFAPDKIQSTGQRRKLLATSNLNGTNMIPALLGLVSSSGVVNKKLSSANSPHLINLMELTAKATILKQDDARKAIEDEMRRYVDV